MLILFDIDGTLLRGSHAPHFEAMRTALRDVFGRPFPPEDDVEKSGRTDLEIVRDVATAQGIPLARFRECRDNVAAAWAERFAAAPFDAARLVPNGLPELLAQLREAGDTLGLVTGNLQPIAAAKLRWANLEDLIDTTIGGFGSDAEDRAALPPIARRRAGGQRPWPRARTVLVGDTPRDVACAHADGLRCIAVTTPEVSPAELAAAEWVARDVDDLAAALAAARSGAERPRCRR